MTLLPRILPLFAATLVLTGCGCTKNTPPTPERPSGGGVGLGRGPESPEGPSPEALARLVRAGSGRGLVRFRSEGELRDYADAMEREIRRRQEESRRSRGATAEDAPGQAAAEAEPSADSSVADGDDAGGESITNNQEQGVDEGGIVKAHGDYLIVLRRGRLFSVRLGDRELSPVSMADAYPPGSRLGTWYDEMLVHDDTIVVVGFSYVHGTGATELGLFHIDDRGVIRHRGTYFLRSNDYYSSRNYASRLVGDTLIFYMPYLMFQPRWENGGMELSTSMPALTRWVGNGRGDDWSEIVQATDIYRPDDGGFHPVLHTVVTCDLRSPTFQCNARGILGSFGRTFYVSRDSVYVWLTEGGHGWFAPPRQEIQETASTVYRLPLAGGDPGALRVWGAPTDQFSFRQDAGGMLNVLVRSEGNGDWMWAPETRAGDVALLRVPVSAFSSRMGTALPAAYTALPRPSEGWSFQNRFVGEHVLYGTGSGWYGAEQARDDRVFVHPVAGGETKALELPHGVDRIEVMGGSAVVIGTDGRSLHFSEVDLGPAPTLAGHFVQEGASQGELRSHGFFFKPSGEDRGVLGLPVRRAGQPGYTHLFQGSAEILYLAVDDHEFSPLGALEARDDGRVSDRCVMSCVDWYGNARPIFYRGRVFALLGYELVEGRIDGGRISEVGRTNFVRGLMR